MTAPDTRIASWIAMALLTPFWWGMGLMGLALLADLFPWCRERVFAVFNRLERTPEDPSMDVPNRVAA
jgi:hypothetical protein